MPKAARKRRKRYSESQRTNILATAQREGLTAAQVKEKFGVTPVTYYSWRKKSGAARRRGGGGRGAGARGLGPIAGMDLTGQVRSAVRSHVEKVVPDVIRSEVNDYLNRLFGGRRRGRPPGRRRRRK